MSVERTLWMFPRNIRRIEPWKLCQITKLLATLEGDYCEQSVQDNLYEALEQHGLKCPKNENGVPNPGGMRTYIAQLTCLGLFWRDPKTKQYELTQAGQALFDAERPVRVLTCQLLRMQYPSPYSTSTQVKISETVRVKPFAFMMDLLEHPRIKGHITTNELVIPVIYGRTPNCLGLCVEKILKLRAGEPLARLIDSPSDLCTSRCPLPPQSAEALQKRLADVRDIANTLKNYMQGVGLIGAAEQLFAREGAFVLTIDPVLAEDITKWRAEPLRDFNQRAAIAWQQNYGRYDRLKITASPKRRRDGFASFLAAQYLNAAQAEPYMFDHTAFVHESARKWGKPEQDIEVALAAVKTKTGSLYRDTLIRAAYSGGKEAAVLEKGMTNIFKQLGFDKSFHTGQMKAKTARSGAYPDVYIRSCALSSSGWADTKATSRYDFTLSDQEKLASYYRECWREIDDKSPSEYFLYIAGGFVKHSESVRAKLAECSVKYTRPVTAVTVEALIDLVEMKERPGPAALTKVFASRSYFNSAEQIIEASRS